MTERAPRTPGNPTGLRASDVERLDTSLPAVAGRRAGGRFVVDDWGLDADLVAVLGRVPGMSAGVRVSGVGRIPDGPALLVWRGAAAGVVPLVVGLGRALGRPVRFTGVPDVVPVVGVARRVGGVGRHPADVRGLLRAGNLVAVRIVAAGLAVHELAEVAEVVAAGVDMPGQEAWLPVAEVQAATAVGVPIVPVVVHAPGLRSLRPRVVVGDPVPTRTRTGVRHLAELASRLAASFARAGRADAR